MSSDFYTDDTNCTLFIWSVSVGMNVIKPTAEFNLNFLTELMHNFEWLCWDKFKYKKAIFSKDMTDLNLKSNLQISTLGIDGKLKIILKYICLDLNSLPGFRVWAPPD